jgi:hypothetical protein
VAAIIGYAARDALDGDAGAAAWFQSADYRWYLDLLGLPPEWLPVGLVEAAASRVWRATSPASGQPSRRPAQRHGLSHFATD